MNGFSVWVGLGASVGLWRVAHSAPQRQAGAWVNAGLFVQLGMLIGARLFYVGVNWGYFSSRLLEIFQIWLGGLAWPGAVGGGMLALLSLTFLNRLQQKHSLKQPAPRSLWILLCWLADQLYPLLPPLAIMTWLASWQAGIAYGPALPAGAWWGVPSLDESGILALHFPLQPLAALTLVIFYMLLELRVKPLRPPGRLAGWAILSLLLNLLAASLLRADPVPTWSGLRVDTWSAIFYLALLTGLVIVNNLVARNEKRAVYSKPEHSSF